MDWKELNSHSINSCCRTQNLSEPLLTNFQLRLLANGAQLIAGVPRRKMAWFRHRRLGSSNFRQQLHILQLLLRSQNPHGTHSAPAQQPLRRQRRRKSVRHIRRPCFRPPISAPHPPHRLRRRTRRLRRPVARRQPPHPTPPILGRKFVIHLVLYDVA